VQGLHKSFAGKPVLQGVDVSIENGEMVAIVGGPGAARRCS